MIYARTLLLSDGTSDVPLGAHVASLARAHDIELDVVAPELERLDPPPGRSVHDRLDRILRIDSEFQVLVIHRDAEAVDRAEREREIQAGMTECGIGWPVVPVIPIRMTEAWLLLDEAAIREVAGRPRGSTSLALPSPRRAEDVPDPKAILEQALRDASGCTGRRLAKFSRDFPSHRRQLLERLDRNGPVRNLSAWQALEHDVANVARLIKAL